MSGQDWCINILPKDGGGAEFIPDLQGCKAGDPLDAQTFDLVTWNNRTPDPHQPWPADSAFKPLPDADVTRGANYLSDEIPAWEPSTPQYQTGTVAATVNYVCKLHPQEIGVINVTVGT